MKAIVNCEELKRVSDRVMVVVPNKPSLPVLNALKIETKDNALVISGTDLESFVEIEMAATIMESGVMYINKDDVKKIYKLSGEVTIQSEDGKCTVSNSKKKSSVAVRSYEEVELPEMPVDKVMDITEENLVSSLVALSNHLSVNNSNVVMTGYSFDGVAGRIVALDGHRLAVKKMEDTFTKKDFKAVVPGFICQHLKKIADVKRNKNIAVYASEKYITFRGKDFTYTCRLIEGKYFDIDNMLNFDADYDFMLVPDEMKKLAKEYDSVVSSGERFPMYIVYDKEQNNIHAGIITSSYMTADVIEGFDNKKAHGLSRDFVSCFNPKFIMQAMQLFGDKVKVSGVYHTNSKTGMQISALVFSDDDFTSLVLPVNGSADLAIQFKEYIAA